MASRTVIVFLTSLMCVSLAFTSRTNYPPKEYRQSQVVTEREVDWWQMGQEELHVALKKQLNVGTAKNVILFIGDGMGPSTVTAARFFYSQRYEIPLEETLLEWEKFPHVALARVYNTDSQTPDSAGTATAFLTGEKSRRGTLGVDQTVPRGNCSSSVGHSMKSILKYSHEAGKWTGVVTTTRVTHATPAAAYASSAERDWESDGDLPTADRGMCVDIARQLVENNDFIRVVLGGGRSSFLPDFQPDPEYPDRNGTRLDGKDLMEDWRRRQLAKNDMSEDKVKLVMNRTEFMKVDPNTVEYLTGLFDYSHMQYEVDRSDPTKEPWGEPSLAEMTQKAIKLLQRNRRNGYFLLVEGGRIDHAHHDNNAYRALTEVVALSDAVKMAVEMTDPTDTLLIMTADHSHGFTISGYPPIDNDILGLSTRQGGELSLADDSLPYLTLSYTNGPGWTHHRLNQTDPRRNLTEEAGAGLTGTKEYLQDAGVLLSSATHSGEDVAIYARGPMSHLLHGSRQQNYIAHVMMYASCVGPNRNHCTKPRDDPQCLTNSGHEDIGIRAAAISALLAIIQGVGDSSWT